ncbi:MAG: hypothetical protein AAFQ98_20955 [Bacteroidota bacterium]
MAPSIKEVLQKMDVEIEEGDFRRIARFTRNLEGNPYHHDHVRRVVLGERTNEKILGIALVYFREKGWMKRRLEDYVNELDKS